MGASQVFFDLGDTQLSSRVIEGPYVDYEQVIPKQNDKQLVVANDRLLPAVRRVSILASSYTHQVRLALSPDSVELSATSQEIGGEAREMVPASYGQEEIEIGYNAVYLMEILRKMDGDEVTIDLLNSAMLCPTAAAFSMWKVTVGKGREHGNCASITAPATARRPSATSRR